MSDLTPLERLQRPDLGGVRVKDTYSPISTAVLTQAEEDMVWGADRIAALQRALREIGERCLQGDSYTAYVLVQRAILGTTPPADLPDVDLREEQARADTQPVSTLAITGMPYTTPLADGLDFDTDWFVVSEAVNDAYSNGEGTAGEKVLEAAFKAHGLVVAHRGDKGAAKAGK